MRNPPGRALGRVGRRASRPPVLTDGAPPDKDFHARRQAIASPARGRSMSQTSYEVRGGIAVVTMQNPPVNGLGHELRSGLLAAVDRAIAEAGVKAIVLVGAGKAFSGGADIKEFDSPKAIAA